jgi:hypothetical protein
MTKRIFNLPYCDLDFRLATSLADLQNADGRAKLTAQGIPNPDSYTYAPYSRVYVRGDGRPAGDGSGIATWTWEDISQEAVDRLLAYFGATDASAEVYIRTRIDTGSVAEFADFSAVMWRPTDDEGKTIQAKSRWPIWRSVMVKFTMLS